MHLDEKHKWLENFEKIFDENSMEIIEFFTIFGNFVTKNRALRNNIICLQQFSHFREGDFPPVPPGYATAHLGQIKWVFLEGHLLIKLHTRRYLTHVGNIRMLARNLSSNREQPLNKRKKIKQIRQAFLK